MNEREQLCLASMAPAPAPLLHLSAWLRARPHAARCARLQICSFDVQSSISGGTLLLPTADHPLQPCQHQGYYDRIHKEPSLTWACELSSWCSCCHFQGQI